MALELVHGLDIGGNRQRFPVLCRPVDTPLTAVGSRAHPAFGLLGGHIWDDLGPV
jgi:hypothetical protein